MSLEELLRTLRLRGWTLHIFGPKDAPQLVAAVFQWDGYADVLIIRDEFDASAYRVPTSPNDSVFQPELVEWQYHASSLWTLRAVLTLDPPSGRQPPRNIENPQPKCWLPDKLPRPVTIRPLSANFNLRERAQHGN